jgi:hypothetical protein
MESFDFWQKGFPGRNCIEIAIMEGTKALNQHHQKRAQKSSKTSKHATSPMDSGSHRIYHSFNYCSAVGVTNNQTILFPPSPPTLDPKM